jgi:hypothetical protein
LRTSRSTRLYTSKLYEELNGAIAAYKSTGNREIIRDAIDSRVARSLRSVEGLLAQGSSRRLPGGGLETQIRTMMESGIPSALGTIGLKPAKCVR